MKCRECAYAKRFEEKTVLCFLYGMIIREDHECRGKGVERHDGDDDPGDGVGAETEL